MPDETCLLLSWQREGGWVAEREGGRWQGGMGSGWQGVGREVGGSEERGGGGVSTGYQKVAGCLRGLGLKKKKTLVSDYLSFFWLGR